jgi:hypothetical protein
VATGEIDAEELSAFVCDAQAYAAIGVTDDDVTDVEWEAADAAYEACMAAADDPGAPTPTTVVSGDPAPGSTTVPATPTTTAVPVGSTATSAPATTSAPRPAPVGTTCPAGS